MRIGPLVGRTKVVIEWVRGRWKRVFGGQVKLFSPVNVVSSDFVAEFVVA